MTDLPPKILRATRRFIDANDRLSRQADRLLNPEHGALEQTFFDTAARVLGELPEGATVVDMGGGRDCEFVKYLPSGRDLRLVAVDISAEELAENHQVDETRVANVAEGLPFAEGEVSLVLSRCLLEHVDGVPAAIRHMGRVLAPGGSAIHYLPCRYSTFALAARLLPFGPLLKALHWINPATKGWIEFEVFYDHCYPAALERLFHEAGFRHVEIQMEWFSTEFYFQVFPVFLLVSLYERLVKKADARSLGAHILVHAER